MNVFVSTKICSKSEFSRVSIVNQSSVGECEYLSYIHIILELDLKHALVCFRFALFPAKTRVLASFRTCLMAIEGS